MTPVVIDASAGIEIVSDTARGRRLTALMPADAVGWVPKHFYVEVAGVIRHRTVVSRTLPEAAARVTWAFVVDHMGQHSHPSTPGEGAGEGPPSLSEQLATVPPHLHRILDQLLPRLVDGAIRRPRRSQPARQLVRLNGPELDQLGADYVAGMTVPQLTRRYGIHRTSVLGHLEKLGIQRRAHVRKLTDK